MIKRKKIDVIRKCKKVRLKEDTSNNPLVYDLISYNPQTKILKTDLDKGLYSETHYLNLSDVEPICTELEIKRIKESDLLLKSTLNQAVNTLSNFLTSKINNL